jgi:DNA mismatch repair protein MutL
MNRIKILSENLANQIAAGEVVERPASVIKELIENSIDAGATRLKVEVELGGRRLICVTDNGSGMMRDDAVLAFERHATSKISTLDDLNAIRTLGFRGEALASIASVAKVEMLTKFTDEQAATRVTIEGGRLIDIKDAARDLGTTVRVRDLFFNTPARRKFMRSEATENYHLASIVTHYALAHPEIAFILTNNGREVLRAMPARDLRERAFQIFGAGLLESLLSVEGGREYVAGVTGFVSAPRERRTTKDSQYFFVNRRFVRDKTITGGLLEGYRSILPHGVYPVAFLFIDIPPEEIDVNVHPAKTEIRFRRGEAVKEVVADAVRNALTNAGITADESPQPQPAIAAEETSRSDNSRPIVDGPKQQPIDFAASVEVPGPTSSWKPNLRKDNGEGTPGLEVHPTDERSQEFDAFDAANSSEIELKAALAAEEIFATASATVDPLPPVNSAANLTRSITPENVSSQKIQVVGQLHESFILATDDEGLLLIDQHVAHERILFDKFRRSEAERNIESQNLLLPETIDLTPAQSQAFELIAADLESLGFGMMKLSGRTIAIKSVPTDLPPAEARNLFSEILDTIEAETRKSPKSTLRDGIAASLACRAAVKINMKLTNEKMRWLIDRLLTTSSPTTCPHGRPVILRLSMKDIERGFHRT